MKKVFIILFVFICQTLIGQTTINTGTINGDTWTKAGSPYLINGNVAIEDLTIEAGVVVEFNANYDFEVNGVFNCYGQFGDSIIFRPVSAWHGILFFNSSDLKEMNYCRIENSSNYGIEVDRGSAPILRNCSVVNNSDNGIHIDRTELYAYNCKIVNNSGNGIYTGDAKIVISNSIISLNTSHGIYSNDSRDSIIVVNSVIAENNNTGILSLSGYLSVQNSIIYDNSIDISSNLTNTIVNYSDIGTLYSGPGIGNISLDPDFADRILYELSDSSPCIDMGNDIPEYDDIYFPPSKRSSRNDMGAYGGPFSGFWYPPLYIQPDSLNFGTTSFGDTARLILKIKNYKDTTISVFEIDFLGNDTSVFSTNVDSFNLDVFDSLNLEINFAPNRQGIFNALVELESNKFGEFQTQLIGEGVIAQINVLENELDFGYVNLGDSLELGLPILNSGGDTLRIFDISATDSNFTINKSIFKINPNHSFDTVYVKFQPTSIKDKIDSLLIFSNSYVGGRFSTPLFGQGFGPLIEVDSTEYDFSSVFLTADSTLNVSINNNGNDTLFLDTLYFENNDLDAFTFQDSALNFPIEVLSGNNYDLPIVFEPAMMGKDSAELIIESDDAFNSMLTLSLNGKGVAPVFVLSDTSLDFGEVTFGASYIDSFVVKNSGNYNLIINSDSLPVIIDNFSIVNVGSYELEQGDSTYIYIRFDAISEGENISELQIVTNDPFNPKDTIQLKGRTYAPHISKSTSYLDFGNVIKDSTADKSFYLYNTGAGNLIIYEDSMFFSLPDSEYFSIKSVEKNPIEQNDSSLIQIRFTAHKAADNQSVLNIFSNDPDSSHIWINLDAFVLVPFIHLPQDSLDFGTIPLNTQLQRSLTIKNTGYDNLTISADSLEIVGNDAGFFKIDSIIGDTIIQKDDSLVLLIKYAANSDGSKQASLKIISDDQVLPLVIVDLKGSSASPEISLSNENIDFGTVLAGAVTSKSLNIRNTGDGDLIIYKDGFELTGSDADSFNILSLISDSTITSKDSMIVEIGLNTNHVGPRSAELQIETNDENKFVNLSGLIIDNEPAIIDLDTQHSSTELNHNQNGNLRFNVSTAFTTDSVMLFYRKGGAESFNKAECNDPSHMNLWEIIIDSSWFDSRGFEYFVRIYHGWRESDWPEKPKSLQVNFDNVEFPATTQKEVYQKISIPFYTGNQSLNDLFWDNLGDYDDTNYRIYDCVNGVDYTEITDMNTELPPGESLWLITKDKVNLDFSNVKTVPTDTTFRLSFHSGWNMIANPFAFPINWAENVEDVELRYYDGTNDWPSVTVMEPYKGYAVKDSLLTEIFLEPKEYSGSTKLTKQTLFSEYDWTINLKVEQNDLHDNFNFAGLKNDASAGIDKYDYEEPPPIGNYVGLYFMINNETTGKTENFSTDIKSESSDGYIYDFDVVGNVAGKKKLIVETISIPEELQYVIVNKQSKIKYPSEKIELYSDKNKLQLIVGSEEFVSSHTVNYSFIPTNFRLEHNFPNPFNPSTTIKYELPKFSKLTISIYNVLGQKVRTLVNNASKDAGYYQTNWDGRNDSGNSVATGLYVLSFRSDQFNKSIKMILQR